MTVSALNLLPLLFQQSCKVVIESMLIEPLKEEATRGILMPLLLFLTFFLFFCNV